MKKEVRRCKYLVPFDSGNEVSCALKAEYKAEDLAIDLRAEVNQLVNQLSDTAMKRAFVREVSKLTDLIISLKLLNEKIICNITTEEVEE